MVFAFWDAKGIIYTEFMPWGMINANGYSQRSGHLSQCVIVQNDSATPHSPHQTQEPPQLFCWEILDSPPYSTDLVLVLASETTLRGHQFYNNEVEIRCW